MRIKPGILWSVLAVAALLCFCAVAGAQGDKGKAEKEAELKQELERKTIALVDETATTSSSLKLPENRVFVLASTAEMLWPYDEKRARGLFWDALGSLNLMLVPASNEGATKTATRQKSQTSYFNTFGLRQDLLRRVARRDPQLALDMLNSTRQPIPEQTIDGIRYPDDSDLEQQIAAEAAARDPKRAMQIARESLAKGLTFQLLDILHRLNERDAQLGSTFAGDLLEKLRTRNLTTDLYGSRIAVDLLVWSRSETGIPAEKSAAVARPLKLEEEQRRQLTELVTNAALGLSANATLLQAVSEIAPEIQAFVPERVALLQRKVAAFNQTLNKEQKDWNRYNSLASNGTPEEMLVAARQANDEQRRVLEQQAVVVAVFRRRADSLREFINTEIEDEGRRKSLTDALDSEQINSAVYQGNASELRELLPRVRRQEERVRAMAEIAVLLEKKGDHDEALKLLDEAQTMSKVDLTSETKTDALLALVGAYAIVEPAKAFAVIEKTIDRANEDIAKLLLLDKLLRSGAVRKGEIMLQHSNIIPLDMAVFKYGKAVAALAAADFNRTKAVADRFGRYELRIMARLMLAQTLLRHDKEAGRKS